MAPRTRRRPSQRPGCQQGRVPTTQVVSRGLHRRTVEAYGLRLTCNGIGRAGGTSCAS